MVMVAAKPDLLRDAPEFEAEVAAYSKAIRETRPIAGGPALRMPFERSRKDRAAALACGWIEVPDDIYREILNI